MREWFLLLIERFVCFLDCGMVGSHDQVVIVNYEEIIGAGSTEGKPRLTYTLAEKSSIQVTSNS